MIRRHEGSFKGPHCWVFFSRVFTLLTNPEDEVVFYGILRLASRSAQGTASSLGSFLLLAWGLPSSFCTIGRACGRGCIGCRVGCCGGGRGHLEAAIVTARGYSQRCICVLPETKDCVDGSLCCPHSPPPLRPC